MDHEGKVSAGRTVWSAIWVSDRQEWGYLLLPSGLLAAFLWNHSQHGVCSPSQEPSGGWILFNLLFHCLCSPLEGFFFPQLYMPRFQVSESRPACPHGLVIRNRFLGQQTPLLGPKDSLIIYFTPISPFSYEYFPYLFAESVINIFKHFEVFLIGGYFSNI